MELTYKQKYTYNIACDPKGYNLACYIITTTEIYGDKNYLSSSSSAQEIPLDRMKKIVSELKKE